MSPRRRRQGEGWLAELLERSDLLRLQGVGSPRSFVHHDPEHRRLELHYFWHPLEQRLLGAVYFGPEAEGPPGCAHGGSIAAVMDDGMGTAAWAAGHAVVALDLRVAFRHFVTLRNWYRFEAWIERVEERKVWTRARLYTPERLHAEGEGLFLTIAFDELFARRPEGPVA